MTAGALAGKKNTVFFQAEEPRESHKEVTSKNVTSNEKSSDHCGKLNQQCLCDKLFLVRGPRLSSSFACHCSFFFVEDLILGLAL